MVVKDPFPKLFQALVKNPHTSISIENNDIAVKVFDEDQKFFLSSPVYSGGNYIPFSVRAAVSSRRSFENPLKVYFTFKEDSFQIFANSLHKLEGMSNTEFMNNIFEFSDIVTKWKDILDERDRNDLIHVRVK